MSSARPAGIGGSRRRLATLAAALLAACGAPPAAPPPLDCGAPLPGAGTGPRLAVLAVIDQGRYDYLVRFRPLFAGGLARLLDTGVSFADAHHFHALTETAPGHAALATGRFPASTGIIGNSWWDRRRGREVEAEVADDGTVGPARLRGEAIGDWLKRADPCARVFAISGKERSAVMLGGRRPDAAFWYDEDEGTFATSDYYLAETPAWVAAFNAESAAPSLLGEVWDPLPVSDEARRAAGIVDVDEGVWGSPFPRALGGLAAAADEDLAEAIDESPFADQLTARFARRLVDEEGLGADDHLDLLAVSFASADAVGHDWGPHSREILDTLLRLDRELGELLAHLDRAVGRDRYLVVLTADHGVQPMPEARGAAAPGAARAGRETVTCLQRAGRELGRRHGPGSWFAHGLYLDEATVRRHGLDRTAVGAEAAELLAPCPGVARVFTAAELARPATASEPIGAAFVHSFDPERSADLAIHWRENFLPRPGRGTSHKTPWAYDTHVPWVVVAPGLAPRQVGGRVYAVDVAPTLAALVGLPPPTGLDGVDRSALLRPAAEGERPPAAR